ncbi:ice-binding family protein [Marinobacter sp.]|uniref:ice-binding family protein n=1 Tax=Marinobacter sp. TaxID=50741 RepID=UPI003A8D16E5
MTTLRRYANRTLWLSAIMLTAFVAGCNSDSNKSSTSPIIPTVTVTSTDPADTATSVPLNSKVVANFSEPMDATTIDSLSFTVAGASGPALTGTISIDANSSSATFTPGSNFTASTLYTATITTAATSVSGKSLAANYVWTFTSGTTADTKAPTVSSTDPANNATDFALNRSITAVFSETLDPASVNPASFTLTADSGATSVSGAVSYSNRLATFNPDSNLAASTLYTATLTTGVTDLAANALAANVVWTFTTGTAIAAGPKPVNLRTAGDFVILTKTGITNVHTSAITGDIGASPITAAAMDNVFCTEITGIIYGSDAAYTGSGATPCFAGAAPDNTLVANAVLDMGTAYTDAAGRTTPDFTELHAGDVSGQTLVPGLYKWGTDVLINTDVTLTGGANDVWVFQISGDIIQASGTHVFLTGGALAKNVFWQVGGGTGVALNTNAAFAGIVLAVKGITVNTGATVNGRLLSQTAVTLDQNTVTQPAP